MKAKVRDIMAMNSTSKNNLIEKLQKNVFKYEKEICFF